LSAAVCSFIAGLSDDRPITAQPAATRLTGVREAANLNRALMCNYCIQLFLDLGGAIAVNQCACDVTSKMSADEELLLLSAAASAAITSLVAFSCKRNRKRAKRLWMRPLLQRQHK